MTIKERIEEILKVKNLSAPYGNIHLGTVLDRLNEAVSRGELAIDPPSREEIRDIVYDFVLVDEEINTDLLINAISTRIRNGREE